MIRMRTFDKYKELIKLMPIIQEASLKGLQRDFEDYGYDINLMRNKFKLFSDNIATIQGKWTLDICYTMLIHGECSFNEIKNALPEISTRTLTDRLRHLEQRGIVKRRVETSKKIRVYYKLSEFGKQEIIFLVPVLLNFVLKPKMKKDYPRIEAFLKTHQSDVIIKQEEVID